jgi:hypothetical protein
VKECFPELLSEAKERIEAISDLDTLRSLYPTLISASSAEEARSLILRADGRNGH